MDTERLFNVFLIYRPNLKDPFQTSNSQILNLKTLHIIPKIAFLIQTSFKFTVNFVTQDIL